MFRGDDVPVTGCRDEHVRPRSSLLHRGDLITSHGGLQSVDGVNFGNDNTSTVRLQGFGALGVEFS
jgi:hypothetical protein